MKKNVVKNAVVLITGASDGIGAALAELLIEQGEIKELHLVARTESKLATVKQNLEAKNTKKITIATHACDCSNEEHVAKLPASVKSLPNIIIHSAGMGQWKYLHELSFTEIKEHFNAPVLAAMFVTRAFLPQIIEKAKKDTNSNFVITSVQSPASVCPWPGCTAYATCRWALRGFCEALRQDLYPLSNQIAVQEVTVGETQSSYFTTNNVSEERMPGIAKILPVFTPKGTAECVLHAIQSNKNASVTYPWVLRAANWLNDYTPVMYWLARVTGYNKL